MCSTHECPHAREASCCWPGLSLVRHACMLWLLAGLQQRHGHTASHRLSCLSLFASSAG